jgi:hypothetical protein
LKNVVRSQDPPHPVLYSTLQLHRELMKQINPILNKQMHLNWIEFNQSGAKITCLLCLGSPIAWREFSSARVPQFQEIGMKDINGQIFKSLATLAKPLGCSISKMSTESQAQSRNRYFCTQLPPILSSPPQQITV